MAPESSTIDTGQLGDALGTVEEHGEQPSGFVIQDNNANSSRDTLSSRYGVDRLLGTFRGRSSGGSSGTDRDRATGRENRGGNAEGDGYSRGQQASPNLEAKSTSSLKLKTQIANGLKGAYHQLAVNFGPFWELDDESASWVAGPASAAMRGISSDIENMPPKVCALIAVGAIVAITLPKVIQTVQYQKAFAAGAAQAQREMATMAQRGQNVNVPNPSTNGAHADEPKDGELPLGERIVTPKDELMGIYAN